MKTYFKFSSLLILVFIIAVGISSFVPETVIKLDSVPNTNETWIATPSEDIKVLKLMAQQCFTCHNPDMGGGRANRLGPPMHKVREHYLKPGTAKEDFINDIVSFVKSPSEEKSKMKGAIRNFGLMPAIYVDTDDTKLIAAYLYDNDLSSEEWKQQWEAFKNN